MQFNNESKNNIMEEFNKAADSDEVRDIMQGFLSMQHLYNAGIKEVKTKLEILDGEFSVKYDRNPIHHIEHRLKKPGSIIEKLKRKGLDVSVESIRNNLFDIAGIRVICSYIDDIYRIADFLASQDDIEIIRVRDYIKNPKPSGYRSLHLVVKIPVFLFGGKEYVYVEVQIRTIAMDFWASLEHQLKYKSGVKDSPAILEQLRECSCEINNIDVKMQNIHKELFNDENS